MHVIDPVCECILRQVAEKMSLIEQYRMEMERQQKVRVVKIFCYIDE